MKEGNMYLHIGNGKSVKKKNVVGIFDLDTATVSSITKKFINSAQKNNILEYTDEDLPRTFVLTEENGEVKVSLSRISTVGLKQRVTADYDDSLSEE